jgi:hypothetical protein
MKQSVFVSRFVVVWWHVCMASLYSVSVNMLVCTNSS